MEEKHTHWFTGETVNLYHRLRRVQFGRPQHLKAFSFAGTPFALQTVIIVLKLNINLTPSQI